MSDIVHIYGCRAIGFHNAPNRDNDCTCGATIESLQAQVAELERLAIVDCKHEWFAACGPDMQGIKTCNKCGYQPTIENVTKAGEDMSETTLPAKGSGR